MRIKVDDIVEVLSGDDKGVRGKVLDVDHQAGKVLVEGVNKVYKHVKKSQKNPQGGRLNREAYVPLSIVQYYCQACGKSVRLGTRYLADGSKERFCRKCKASQGRVSPARATYAAKK